MGGLLGHSEIIRNTWTLYFAAQRRSVAMPIVDLVIETLPLTLPQPNSDGRFPQAAVFSLLRFSAHPGA